MRLRTLEFGLVAGILLGLLGGSAQAATDKVKNVSINPAQFGPAAYVEVSGDGKKFTSLDSPDMKFGANLAVECKTGNKLRGASLFYGTPSISGGILEASTIPSKAVTHSVEKEFSKADTMVVSKAKIKTGLFDPVGICNGMLDSKVEQGENKYTLLKNGFETSGIGIYSFAARCQTGVGDDYLYWEADSFSTIVQVNCLGNPNAGTPQIPSATNLQVPFEVTEASVALPGSPVKKFCPSTVNLKAKIKTNGKGEVKFRTIHNGAKGKVITANFTEADTFHFDVPIQVGKKAGGIGGFKAAAEAPKGPINDIAADPPGTHSGWVAIETTSPKGKIWEKGFYKVVCTGPQVGTIGKGAAKDMKPKVSPKPGLAPQSPGLVLEANPEPSPPRRAR